jgi:hypothetical protein
MGIRKAITIYDEDSSMTLFKPFSEEYKNQLLVIYEDAYGEAVLEIKSIKDIQKNFGGSDEEFNEILTQLS